MRRAVSLIAAAWLALSPTVTSAQTVQTLGAGSARGFGFAGSAVVVSGAAFVTAAHYTPSTSAQAVSFSGASAGNLALIIVSNSTSVAPSAPTGWTALATYTWVTYGYHEAAFYKVLNSGDISTGSVTVSGLATDSTVEFLDYSGVSSAALVSTGDVTASPLAISGFTKNAASKVIVAYCTNRTATGNATLPSGMTNRIANFASTNFQTRVDDFLPSSGYANGASVTYTATVGFEVIGRLIELT